MDPAVEQEGGLKTTAADTPGSSPGEEPAPKSSTARRFGNGLLSLIGFIGFALFVLGLLFALALGGLVVGALAVLLTGSAHQGLVVGVALTGWECLIVGVVAPAVRRKRLREGEIDAISHSDGSAATHSKPNSPGLGDLARGWGEIAREGATLIGRVLGAAAICALAPVVVAGALTGNVLTAVAVGIVAFPVVLVQVVVAIKVGA
jgi:hypothetical protein